MIYSVAFKSRNCLCYTGVLYVEVILYSKECNWYTRCCPLNGGVCYRECPLRETILYTCTCTCTLRHKSLTINIINLK